MARTEELLHDASGDTWAEADLLGSLSGLYAYLGRSADARAAIDRSQSIIAGFGAKLVLAETSVGAGLGELTLGDPVAAERYLRAGYETLQAMGERYYLAMGTVILAEALYDQGRFDEAAQMIEEPLDGVSPVLCGEGGVRQGEAAGPPRPVRRSPPAGRGGGAAGPGWVTAGPGHGP